MSKIRPWKASDELGKQVKPSIPPAPLHTKGTPDLNPTDRAKSGVKWRLLTDGANRQEKLASMILIGYLVWLFLFQFLVNDVWIRWEDTNIPVGLVGSWIWALIKFAYWCLPIIISLFFFGKERLLSFKQMYTFHCKKPLTLLVIPLWGFFILLSNGFKIPSLDYFYSINGIIAAPLIEEFVFRGFILNELSKKFSFVKANIVQGILFSLNHLPWLYALGLFHSPIVLFSRLLFLAFFGMVSGFLVKNTKSLIPSVLFHAINNLLY